MNCKKIRKYQKYKIKIMRNKIKIKNKKLLNKIY